MLDPEIVDEFDSWIPEVIAASLARDIESRLNSMISAMSAPPEPVTQQDFHLQALVLQRTRRKLAALEAKLGRMAETGRAHTPVSDFRGPADVPFQGLGPPVGEDAGRA